MRIEDKERAIILLSEARIDLQKVVKLFNENEKFTLELENVIKIISEEIRELLR